jgi:hypothetical protein
MMRGKLNYARVEKLTIILDGCEHQQNDDIKIPEHRSMFSFVSNGGGQIKIKN